jgi:hypothetical protein
MALEHTGKLNEAFCDAMLAGYVQAITADAQWLIERARTGDHVVGLVEGGRVRTAVRHPYGLLAKAADAEELPFNCG